MQGDDPYSGGRPSDVPLVCFCNSFPAKIMEWIVKDLRYCASISCTMTSRTSVARVQDMASLPLGNLEVLTYGELCRAMWLISGSVVS
jgi:hypothetical protein